MTTYFPGDWTRCPADRWQSAAETTRSERAVAAEEQIKHQDKSADVTSEAVELFSVFCRSNGQDFTFNKRRYFLQYLSFLSGIDMFLGITFALS